MNIPPKTGCHPNALLIYRIYICMLQHFPASIALKIAYKFTSRNVYLFGGFPCNNLAYSLLGVRSDTLKIENNIPPPEYRFKLSW